MTIHPTPKRTRLTWLLMGFVLAGMIGCGPQTFVVNLGGAAQGLEASAIQRDGKLGSRHVAMLDISGTLTNSNAGGLLAAGDNAVAKLAEGLRAAAGDAKVAAVILRVNTPGGTVTASDMMYQEIRRFRQQTGKPVIVLMMDLATSGGYYLACAADRIVAYPTTVTGSIGVIFPTFTVKPALDRLGVRTDAIVSGPNKAAASPFETLEDDQRTILQDMVDDFYRRFVGVVREGRPTIRPETFGMITDGRVFTGRRALELGLVDEVGDVHTAFAAAKSAAGLESADLIVYHRPMQYVTTPYSRGGGTPPSASGTARADAATATQINLLQLNLDTASLLGPGRAAGLYYLWQPELP